MKSFPNVIWTICWGEASAPIRFNALYSLYYVDFPYYKSALFDRVTVLLEHARKEVRNYTFPLMLIDTYNLSYFVNVGAF